MEQDLAALLAATRQLLDGAEPSLTDCQDYRRERDELFQRIVEFRAICHDGVSDAETLRQLLVSVLEQDELLMREIRRQLSNISQQMIEVSDRRRLLKSYGLAAGSASSSHLHTA
jgi:hypothetical protein